MTKPMKMWRGNVDGIRIGAVVASSKTRAMQIVRASRKEFEDYWVQQSAVDPTLEPDQLYTRLRDGKSPWQKGLCPR